MFPKSKKVFSSLNDSQIAGFRDNVLYKKVFKKNLPHKGEFLSLSSSKSSLRKL